MRASGDDAFVNGIVIEFAPRTVADFPRCVTRYLVNPFDIHAGCIVLRLLNVYVQTMFSEKYMF